MKVGYQVDLKTSRMTHQFYENRSVVIQYGSKRMSMLFGMSSLGSSSNR